VLSAAAARAVAHDMKIDGNDISMVLENPDAGAPALIRALVEAGAEIREVFDEQPAMEDVYLKLLGAKGASA
jgi:ABC-2 type transport system ATP-binding protein